MATGPHHVPGLAGNDFAGAEKCPSSPNHTLEKPLPPFPQSAVTKKISSKARLVRSISLSCHPEAQPKDLCPHQNHASFTTILVYFVPHLQVGNRAGAQISRRTLSEPCELGPPSVKLRRPDQIRPTWVKMALGPFPERKGPRRPGAKPRRI